MRKLTEEIPVRCSELLFRHLNFFCSVQFLLVFFSSTGTRPRKSTDAEILQDRWLVRERSSMYVCSYKLRLRGNFVREA